LKECEICDKSIPDEHVLTHFLMHSVEIYMEENPGSDIDRVTREMHDLLVTSTAGLVLTERRVRSLVYGYRDGYRVLYHYRPLDVWFRRMGGSYYLVDGKEYVNLGTDGDEAAERFLEMLNAIIRSGSPRSGSTSVASDRLCGCGTSTMHMKVPGEWLGYRVVMTAPGKPGFHHATPVKCGSSVHVRVPAAKRVSIRLDEVTMEDLEGWKDG
jgi:hypothetical protein